jgi:hypothetical protein
MMRKEWLERKEKSREYKRSRKRCGVQKIRESYQFPAIG